MIEVIEKYAKKIIIYTSRDDVVNTNGGSTIRIEGLTSSLESCLYIFIAPVRPKYINKGNFVSFKLNKYELILCKVYNISPFIIQSVLAWFIKKNTKIKKLVKIIGSNYFLTHQDMTLALVLKKIYNTKIIYDIHGFNFCQELAPENSLNTKQKVLIAIDIKEEKKIINEADYINAVSIQMKDLLVNRFKVDPKKFFIVKDGILSLLQKEFKSNSIIKEIKKKIGGRFAIGFIGNFKVQGGVLNLINAYKELDKEKYFLLLIGNGSLEDEVFNQLNSYNSYYIKSISYNELYTYQQCVDLLICPDLQNNLYNKVVPSSLKVYDSLLSNKKVLMTYFSFWDGLKIKYPKNIYFTDSSVADLKDKIIEISNMNVTTEKIENEFKVSVTYKEESRRMVSQYQKNNIL